MILGGFLGYLLGIVLYQFLLKYIQSNPTVVYWCTIIACIIGLVVIAWFFYDHILILGTSFIGAYGVIRGISFMAGHFPDERQIIDLMEAGEYTQVSALMTWQVYVYLISALILGVIGTIVQYKFFYEPSEEKDVDKSAGQQEDTSNLIPKTKK